jgi:hypothetical protein
MRSYERFIRVTLLIMACLQPDPHMMCLKNSMHKKHYIGLISYSTGDTKETGMQ